MDDVDLVFSYASKKDLPGLPLSCDPPGPNNPPKQRVWIIFGGTGHMGRSVVKNALSKGDLVTMVGRSLTDDPASMYQDIIAAKDIARKAEERNPVAFLAQPSREFDNEQPSNLLCLVCDVRARSSVATTLASHFRRWGDGQLDIVANCSGYGVFGACEDQDDAEIRNQFETNFWGTVHIVQLSLPFLRASGGGRYLIFSSTSGALGVPGLGPYCATKYAVEGLVESMLYEIDAFDIKATLVSPGHVRRDEPEDSGERAFKHESGEGKPNAGSVMPVRGPRPHQLPAYSSFVIKQPSAPYSNSSNPAFHAKRVVQWLEDSQPTSVVKAAELIWQLAHCTYPPLRLLLGSFAVESVRDRLRTIMEEIEDWKFLSFGEEIDIEKARDRVWGKEPSRSNSEDEEDAVPHQQQQRQQQQRQQQQQQQQPPTDLDGRQDDVIYTTNADDEESSDIEDEFDLTMMEED